MQLRDTGTQRGLREGSSAAAVHGDPAHAIQAARNTAGERGDFYLFSPSSPGKSKPWPQLRTVRGLSGQMGCSVGVRLRCGSAGSMAWSSTELSGQQTWAPPGLRHCPRSCLPGLSWLPGVWCSFSPSSAAVPVTRPPACLGESSRAFSSWSKKTKPKQIKERGGTCPSGGGSLSIHILWPRDAHGFLPGVSGLTISTEAQTRGVLIHCAQQSGRDGGSKEDRVQPFPAALRCSAPDAVTPTLLLQFL